MHRGYIRLWRKIEDFDWYRNPNILSLWIHILLKANHKDKNYQGIVIKRGSFMTGLKTLSNETGLTTQQIRTAIKKLELTNNITSKATNKYRIITVCKYDEYQNDNKQDNKQVTNKQQSSNNQVTTTNNYKELKNDKNDKKVTKRFVRPSIEELENYCKEKDYKIDCTNFFNYYESNGWKVGKNSMKSWSATLATWNARNEKDTTPIQSETSKAINDNLFGGTKYAD